jgi:hypothetical protein
MINHWGREFAPFPFTFFSILKWLEMNQRSFIKVKQSVRQLSFLKIFFLLIGFVFLTPANAITLGWETGESLKLIQIVEDSSTTVPGQSFKKLPLSLSVENVIVNLEAEIHVHPMKPNGDLLPVHIPVKGDWFEIRGRYFIKENEELFEPASDMVIIYFNKFTGALFPGTILISDKDKSYTYEYLSEVGGITKLDFLANGKFEIHALVKDFKKSDFEKPVPFTVRFGDRYVKMELQLDSMLRYSEKK